MATKSVSFSLDGLISVGIKYYTSSTKTKSIVVYASGATVPPQLDSSDYIYEGTSITVYQQTDAVEFTGFQYDDGYQSPVMCQASANDPFDATKEDLTIYSGTNSTILLTATKSSGSGGSNKTYYASVYYNPGIAGSNATNMPSDDKNFESTTASWDYNLSSKTPKWSGYDFNGWYSEDYNETFDPGASFPVDGSTSKNTSTYTLVAQWKEVPKTYYATVEFDTDGGSSVSSISLSGTSSTLSANLPSGPKKTGYTFYKWEFGGKEYKAGALCYFPATESGQNHVVTALWTPNTYTIRLYLNDGTNDYNDVSVTYDEFWPDVSVPSRTGYKFLGYETSGGTQYYDANGYCTEDGRWDRTSTLSLYAQWDPNEYVVYLNHQNETSTTTTYAVFGEYLNDVSKPVKTGLKFKGYYTEVNGVKVFYINADGEGCKKWDIAKATTLYAHWVTEYSLTIRYDPAGGSPEPSPFSDSQEENNTFYVDMPSAPTKTGYTFQYWTWGGKTYKPNEEYTITTSTLNENRTFTAIWKANEYTITLDNLDGTKQTTYVTYDGYLPDVTAPKRVGYGFYGYRSEQDGEGTKYYNSDGTHCDIVWKIASNTTLYAHWIPINYTVYLDPCNGDEITTITTPYGEYMKSVDIPKNGNLTFIGYYTEKTGGTKYVDLNGNGCTKWNIAKTTTLYAHWVTAKRVIVHYISDGVEYDSLTYINSSDPTNANVSFDVIDPPDKKGHTFNGWDYDGKTYMPDSSNQTVVLTGSENGIDYYMYALWTVNQYTISFNANGGTGGPSAIKVTYGKRPAESISVFPTLNGYKFVGYYDNTGSSPVLFYDKTGAYVLDSVYLYDFNLTLFARWLDATKFDWTYEKRTGMAWNLTAQEWNDLQDFVNARRAVPYSFNHRAVAKTDDYEMAFTFDMYNDMVNAIGKGTKVKRFDPITEELMYELVDNANAITG